MLSTREQQACDAIDSVSTSLQEVSQYIHDNPELGLSEHKAVGAISQWLHKQGFACTIGLGSVPELQTAMVAHRGPTDTSFRMAFLGEYDALPGLGHGCGHNLIAMMSMGAAYGFSVAYPEAYTTFFGCPAEETIGGKVFMADAGLFSGYDGALIIHPGGRNEMGGTSLATHPLEVTYYGRSSHVASLTDTGVNALTCAVQLYSEVQKVLPTFPGRAIVGAIFTEAGKAPNVVPDRATVRMTVRGSTVHDLETIILPTIKRIATSIAHAHSATVDMHHYEPLFKDMRQDETLMRIMTEVMTELGEQPVMLSPDEADGSTDVGNVTYEVPTVHPTLCIGNGLETHTPAFADAAGSRYGYDQAIKGAKIMAITALRYGEDKGVF